jgi:uncharacterized protein YuzE
MNFQLLKWLTGRQLRSELQTKYDVDADLLFARFGPATEADTIVVDGDVAVRLSRETGEPVGIEVVDCAAKFRKPPAAITAAFARELLALYGQKAKALVDENRRRRSALLRELEPAHRRR